MRNKLNKRQHNTNQREAAQKDDDLPETRSRENTACTTAPPANIQNGRQGAQKWAMRSTARTMTTGTPFLTFYVYRFFTC